nr:MAG TPA: hypothetical protein [Caudoviricetes sp.]
MSTITKEWLQQKIADMEAARDEIPFGLDEDDSNTLAAMKLVQASLEAEPVAYADPQAFRNFQAGVARREWMWRNPGEDLIAVYTAPPAPVSVSDERSSLNNGIVGFDEGWNACRAAMLQGADGKPELTVWYGSMPESNGKANWTAILHRKGEGRCMDGFTIDRSEYPGRVLYAADRVRYLIGEKSERPSILDYDADAHSGYVKPGNSPVIPDGWVLAPLEPTEEMCDVGHVGVDVLTGVTDGNEYYSIDGEDAAKVYRAMKAAAPQKEVKP